MLSTLCLPILALAMAVPVSGFKLTSKNFADGAAIPMANTCENADRSPELSWVGVPKGTKSLALVVHDPDAPDPAKPTMDVTHWVVYDLPATTVSLPEGASTAAMPHGARQGKNEKGEPKWMGPCPPVGNHRYFFTLYALSAAPKLPDGATKSQVLDAVQKHLLGKAELMGTYQKGAKK